MDPRLPIIVLHAGGGLAWSPWPRCKLPCADRYAKTSTSRQGAEELVCFLGQRRQDVNCSLTIFSSDLLIWNSGTCTTMCPRNAFLPKLTPTEILVKISHLTPHPKIRPVCINICHHTFMESKKSTKPPTPCQSACASVPILHVNKPLIILISS